MNPDIPRINPPMIVLTGGPCAGKTGVISHLREELTARGFNVFLISETATELHSMGVIFDCYRDMQVQSAILRLQIEKERSIVNFANALNSSAGRSVILCDRGIMDQMAYMEEDRFLFLLEHGGRNGTMSRFHALHRYDAVLHLRTAALGAEEYYTLANNDARKESLEEARVLDQKCADAWNGTPHLRIFGNEDDFAVKKRKVLAEVCNILGVPEPMEIERKWLVETESAKDFLLGLDATISTVHITQAYLIDGGRLRERRGEDRGDVVYSHTYKTEIENGISFEIETPLTEERYNILLHSLDPKHSRIFKNRHMFIWEDRYWELDEFLDVENNRTGFFMLETEFSTEEMLAEVTTPPFLRVIRDVTGESAFKNKHIAILGLPALA